LAQQAVICFTARGRDFRNTTKPAEFSKRMEKLQVHIELPSAGWLGIKLGSRAAGHELR
jgi:hypothetical protein